MIKFIKTPHHFKNLDDETEGVTVNIETNGQTLGEITEAFNRFLTACGYQLVDKYEYEIKELTLEELEEFTSKERQEKLEPDIDDDEE